MSEAAGKSLLDHFAGLDDPRQAAKVLYPLPEILLLLLSATLAGADDCVEMEFWAGSNSRFCAASCPTGMASPATTR